MLIAQRQLKHMYRLLIFQDHQSVAEGAPPCGTRSDSDSESEMPDKFCTMTGRVVHKADGTVEAC